MLLITLQRNKNIKRHKASLGNRTVENPLFPPYVVKKTIRTTRTRTCGKY
jgi:hypothetical protein